MTVTCWRISSKQPYRRPRRRPAPGRVNRVGVQHACGIRPRGTCIDARGKPDSQDANPRPARAIVRWAACAQAGRGPRPRDPREGRSPWNPTLLVGEGRRQHGPVNRAIRAHPSPTNHGIAKAQPLLGGREATRPGRFRTKPWPGVLPGWLGSAAAASHRRGGAAISVCEPDWAERVG